MYIRLIIFVLAIESQLRKQNRRNNVDTISIIYPTGQAPLYKKYPNQTSEQDAYVELDCVNKTLAASYNSEIGNAVPFTVYHGHDQRFGCNAHLSESAVKSLLDECLPFAERIVQGYKSYWDGNNHRARFTDDAQTAIEEMNELCSGNDSDETVEVWDVYDWLDGVLGEIRNKIAAGESVDAIANYYTDDAAAAGVVIEGSIINFITEIANA